jgi:2,3-bisphosphoglycerate-dependent phosphoglycerate mutase
MPDLVLLRHGRSEWNDLNLFAGWQDVDLSPAGEEEARSAGDLLHEEPGLDILVVHTSLLTRAIRTANISLAAAGRSWINVRRSWRLNERHYGDLTGKNKKQVAEEFGLDQVKLWRRSFDVSPPLLMPGDSRDVSRDARYRDVPVELMPRGECLRDVVSRVSPYLRDVLIDDLRSCDARHGAVLVVAHGNSLRALRMMLEKIRPEEISDLEIPTGIPFRLTLDDEFGVLDSRYLGDPEVARRAAEAVARQAG